MSDVKVEIDRTATDGTFTNHDIIRGSIHLVVTKAITLNWIQAKIEGISTTQLAIPRENPRKDRERKDKIIRDQHKVLYDTQIVFPPDNVRQVSNAKDFTLAPGNYSYPFEFKIPLNNSCVKMSGITNKVQMNIKSFDVMINNGNLSTTYLQNKAHQFLSDYASSGGGNGGKGNRPPSPPQLHYHITSQLPPSLSGIGEFANIKYFIKVTCKRSSIFKTNLRAHDPFIFLPLDLDASGRPLLGPGDPQYEVDYKEAFVRKEVVFRNRIPEIVAFRVPSPAKKKKSPEKVLPKVPYIAPKRQGFLSRLFSAETSPSASSSSSLSSSPAWEKSNGEYRGRNSVPEIHCKDVPFSFEIRFRHPAFLIPTKPPSFKLFFISTLNPLRYTLNAYGRPEESNGLGVVYLQKLTITLTSTTTVSVVENDGASHEYHMGQHEEVMTLCNNTYQNLKFDLMHSQINRNATSVATNIDASGSLYEIEIPRKYYDNCVIPDHISPTFKTCNITRKYNLTAKAGFSCERIDDFRNRKEMANKVKFVELQCANIKVLSGLNMTSALQSNASRSSVPRLSSASQGSFAKLPTPPPSVPFNNRERQYSHNSISPALQQGTTTPVSNGHGSGNGGNSSMEKFEVTGDDNAGTNQGQMLPTYDDVVLESSYQDDSEHQRARRRYQQHEQYYYNLD
ncbi:uncharacterized protein LODBEIA_P60250 [Lodderomyces beijingensis]|uniref:Arrestin-like N-terminal domain-containing protein n=1 Tax=Lodderomyces beijingensis TaxID=1775926 RepID=A0ABP0ZUJ3_9ASCO